MKNILGIILRSLLWCNIGITGERKPGTDQKCFDIFEREKIFEKVVYFKNVIKVPNKESPIIIKL